MGTAPRSRLTACRMRFWFPRQCWEPRGRYRLDGTVEVSIPPAAQPGLVLRLAGKVLPNFGGRGHGDLYLRLEVRIPERLSKRQRELYEQLRALEKPGRR